MTNSDHPERLLTPQDVTDLIGHWLKVAGPPPSQVTTAGIPGRLLTARQVAELLGFSMATIIRWWERGEIPGYRIGGRIRFREDELAEWLESRRSPNA
jgi:excisionase family DNA binding protein